MPVKAKVKPRPHFGDWDVAKITAVLVLADGTVIEGYGFGADPSSVSV